jgi:zinc protease
MNPSRAARFIVGGLTSLSFAQPAVAAAIPSHPRQLQFEEFTFRPPAAANHRIELPGGHVAFLIADAALPLVDVAVALQVGSYLDPPHRAGLALMTGALLRRGGTEILSADAFDERVDFLGAELGSHFGELRGGLSLSVPAWELDAGLDLLFDALYRPAFDPGRLEDLRANVLEGIGRRNVEPLDVLEREWQWLLFGEGSFLTRPLTATSVRAITRSEIVGFHHAHVEPARLVFAVSGDITREGLLTRLSPRLEGRPSRPGAGLPPAPTHRPAPGLYVVDFDTPQAKVLLGHRAVTPTGPAERAATRVMAEILGGGGAISRIAGRLRTAEGLVYRASASFDMGEPWPRDFRVFFETATGSVARATRLSIEEIQRLRRELVHPQELAVVLESIASSLRLDFGTAEKAAGRLAEDELLERPEDTTESRYRLVREVTREEVRRAARELLAAEDLLVLVVGRADELLARDGESRSPLEQAIGLDAVRLPPRDPLTLGPLEGAGVAWPQPEAKR